MKLDLDFTAIDFVVMTGLWEFWFPFMFLYEKKHYVEIIAYYDYYIQALFVTRKVNKRAIYHYINEPMQ